MDDFRPYNQAAQGRQLKDLDLVKWIEGKLGEGQWCGRAGAAIFSKEMLEELETCFQSLQPQYKLKLILSLLYMHPRNMGTWSQQVKVIIDLAQRDADDWVEMISELYKDIPITGVVTPKIENPDAMFSKTLSDLQNILDTYSKNGTINIVPRGYEYVNNTVSKNDFGVINDNKQHFVLKKKPKSFTLEKDVQKQMEAHANLAANKLKNGGVFSATIPIKMRSTLRKGNNDLPMKGIPMGNAVKMNAGFTNESKKFQRQPIKREGGAKLLEIAELPQPLKKRRQTEQEEERKKRNEEKELARQKIMEERRLKEETRRLAMQKAKDQSLKLTEKKKEEATKKVDNVPNSASPVKRTTSTTVDDKPELKSPPPTTPTTAPFKSPMKFVKSMAFTPASERVQKTMEPQPITTPEQKPAEEAPKQDQNKEQPKAQPAHPPPVQVQAKQQLSKPELQHSQTNYQEQASSSALSHDLFSEMTSSEPKLSHRRVAQSTLSHQQATHSNSTIFMDQHQPQSHHLQQTIQQVSQVPQQQSSSVTQQAPTPVPVQTQTSYLPQQQPSYLNVQLAPTRNVDQEQRARDEMIMNQFNQIVRDANVLKPEDRKLIYSFLSGDRRNHHPEMGNIVTVRLSDSIEKGLREDKTTCHLQVEMFFQMDYSNGEWKRLRKCRLLAANEVARTAMKESKPRVVVQPTQPTIAIMQRATGQQPQQRQPPAVMVQVQQQQLHHVGQHSQLIGGQPARLVQVQQPIQQQQQTTQQYAYMAYAPPQNDHYQHY